MQMITKQQWKELCEVVAVSIMDDQYRFRDFPVHRGDDGIWLDDIYADSPVASEFFPLFQAVRIRIDKWAFAKGGYRPIKWCFEGKISDG